MHLRDMRINFVAYSCGQANVSDRSYLTKHDDGTTIMVQRRVRYVHRQKEHKAAKLTRI